MTWRPFTFHVAVSWARKNRSDDGQAPFSPDSCIGKWRDEMLSLRRDGDGKDPGDDFFYITKVSCVASRFACVDVLICRRLVCRKDHRSEVLVLAPFLPGPLFVIQGVAFGVADGFNAWERDKVEPSLFPQSLMYYAYRDARGLYPWVESTPTDPQCSFSPTLCIKSAYDCVLEDEEVEAGMFPQCWLSLLYFTGLLQVPALHI